MLQNTLVKSILNAFNYLFINILLFFSLSTYAQFQEQAFLQDYQYTYINKHVNQKNNKNIQQLEKSLTKNTLTHTEKYFFEHNLSYLLFKQHHKEETLKQLAKTIKLAKKLDSYHLANSLLLRAKTYGILFRDTNAAIKDLQQALLVSKSSQHPKNLHLQFDLQTAMAQAYNQLSQLKKAKIHIELALSIAKKLNNNNESIYALIIAGRIAFQQNNFDLAFQNYLKALQLSDDSTPIKRIASIELRLAIAYETQGVFKPALVHAKKAANLYSQLNEERLQIKSLRVLGNIYLTLEGDIDTALVHFINGLTIADTINDPYFIGQMQYLIGHSYLLEHNLKQAEKYLIAAQKILKATDAWFYLGLNNLELAKLAKTKGDTKQAINLTKSLLAEHNAQNYPSLINEGQLYLLKLYVQQKQFKNAYWLQNKRSKQANITQKQQIKVKQAEFKHKVVMEELNNNLKKIKQEKELLQQQINNSNEQNKLILLLLFVLSGIVIWLFVQNKQWQKRYNRQVKNSQLTWLGFKKQLSQIITTETNLSLLATLAAPALKANNNLSQYQQDLITDQCLQQVKGAHLGIFESQRHGILWQLSRNSFERINKNIVQLTQQNNNLLAEFIWIDLNDFPQNISEQCLMLIEELVYHLRSKTSQIQYCQLLKITIQAKALALIFSPTMASTITAGIEKAIQQKLILSQIIALDTKEA